MFRFTRSQCTLFAIATAVLWSFCSPAGVAGTIEAQALAKFRVTNDSRDGEGRRMAVDDYHMKVKHHGPGNLNFRRGKFGSTDIGAGNVTGNGTPEVSIDLDVAVGPRNDPLVQIVFVQARNAIRVTESYWTVKDVSGNSVRVPEIQDGNAKVPGFAVAGDPEYTIFNDFEQPIGIRNLSFLVNVPELDLDSLVPGLEPGFGLTVADFVLPGLSSMTFSVPGIITPGNFMYSQGEIWNDTFADHTGDFIHGHQSEIPEPGTLSLIAFALAFVCLLRSRLAAS